MNFHVRLASLAVAASLLIGCGSLDKYEYVSTPHLPTTVSLMNTANDEVFWKMDIPVGHKLKLDFDRPGDIDFLKVGKTPADKFAWKLQTVDGEQTEKGTEQLSGMPFVVKVNYRRPGEMATAMTQQPAPQPTQAVAPQPAPQPTPQPVQVHVTPAPQPQPAANEPMQVQPAPQPTAASTYESPQPMNVEVKTVTLDDYQPIEQTAPQPQPVTITTIENTSPPAETSGGNWESPTPVDEPTTITATTDYDGNANNAAGVNMRYITPAPQPQAARGFAPQPAPEAQPAQAEPVEVAATPEPQPQPETDAIDQPESTAINLDDLFGKPEPAQVIRMDPIRTTVTATPAPVEAAPQPATPVQLPPINNVYQSPQEPSVDVPTPNVESPVIKVESSERITAPAEAPKFESQPKAAPPPQLRFDAPSPGSLRPQFEPHGAAPTAKPVHDAQAAAGFRVIPVKVETQLVDQYDPATVSVLIEGVPRDASLSAGRNNGSGIWTVRGDQLDNLALKMPNSADEDVQLLVIATAPTATGDTASSIANMTVRAAPFATAPTEAGDAWR